MEASQLSSELRAQIELQKTRLREAHLALEQKEIEMQRLKETKVASYDGRASLKVAHKESKSSPSMFSRRTEPQTSSVSAHQRGAVQALKGNVKRELQQVVRLIQQRDQMYRSFQSKSGTVSFKPQQTRTQRGRTIAKITSGISKAGSVNELAVLQRDIREIQARVKEDLALMKRLG